MSILTAFWIDYRPESLEIRAGDYAMYSFVGDDPNTPCNPDLSWHPCEDRPLQNGDIIKVVLVNHSSFVDQRQYAMYFTAPRTGHFLEYVMFDQLVGFDRKNVGVVPLHSLVKASQPVGASPAVCRCQTLLIGHDPDCPWMLSRKGSL